MRKKLIWIVPLGLLGMVIFAWIGGQLVMNLWNWLAPALFGFREVTFWQALGLLALCRILFGGFRLGGDSPRSKRRCRKERWDQMTSEERERFRQWSLDRGGSTTPLDSNTTV